MEAVQLLASSAENLLAQHGIVSHGVINYEQSATDEGAGVNVFIDSDDYVVLSTEDGDHLLTFEFDPADPIFLNRGMIDNLKTDEHIEVHPRNMNAFAHYLLGFFVEF